MKPSHFVAIALVCFCLINSAAQETGKFMSLSISNNGQVKGLIDEIHFDEWATYPTGSTKYADDRLKFEALFETGLKNNFYLMSKIGFGYFSERYVYNDGSANGKMTQQFYNVALGLTRRTTIQKLTISTGLYIPFIKISDFKVHNHEYSVGNRRVLDDTYKGGFATGLNGVVSVRFNLVDKLYFISSMSVGIIHQKTGGHVWYKQYFKDSDTHVESSASAFLFKSTQISKPDLSIGIGYNFD